MSFFQKYFNRAGQKEIICQACDDAYAINKTKCTNCGKPNVFFDEHMALQKINFRNLLCLFGIIFFISVVDTSLQSTFTLLLMAPTMVFYMFTGYKLIKFNHKMMPVLKHAKLYKFLRTGNILSVCLLFLGAFSIIIAHTTGVINVSEAQNAAIFIGLLSGGILATTNVIDSFFNFIKSVR